jgi:hypothetical protein
MPRCSPDAYVGSHARATLLLSLVGATYSQSALLSYFSFARCCSLALTPRLPLAPPGYLLLSLVGATRQGYSHALIARCCSLALTTRLPLALIGRHYLLSVGATLARCCSLLSPPGYLLLSLVGLLTLMRQALLSCSHARNTLGVGSDHGSDRRAVMTIPPSGARVWLATGPRLCGRLVKMFDWSLGL